MPSLTKSAPRVVRLRQPPMALLVALAAGALECLALARSRLGDRAAQRRAALTRR